MTSVSRIAKSAGLTALVSFGALTLAPTANAAGLLHPKNQPDAGLDLQDHHVTVIIENGYAVTSIDQVFANPHNNDMEAVYSFPVPEKAAIAEFTYWIDGKPVTGEVLPKQQARQVYETEKQAGRETALAEENPARNFDISVYPVRAGQDVRTRLRYIQPVHLDTGMGRYLYPLEEGGVDDAALQFWTSDNKVQGNFSFTMKLRTDYAIDAVRLPAHPNANISQTKNGHWQIDLANHTPTNSPEEELSTTPRAGPATHLDKDIIVNWRNTPGQAGTIGLTTYKDSNAGTGTFMLTVNPGIDLKPVTEGRDWIFVLDKSGSMKGKYAALLDAVGRGLGKLPANDRFQVMLFDNQVTDITRGYQAATAENIAQALNKLQNSQPSNGTDLYKALDAGLDQADQDRTTGIILVTDGVANVGVTEKQAFFDLVKKRDTRLFTMIMGNSANTPLLQPMTEYSGGTAISLSNSDDMVGAVLSATSKLSHEALHDVSVTIDGVKTADITPNFIPTLYRGQQLVLTGHYWGSGDATIRFKTRISGEMKTYEGNFHFPETNVSHPELERLWAFATIEGLMREMQAIGADADADQAITDLAVQYGLVTPYTSMVVVRDEVFKQLGITRQNRDRVTRENTASADRQAAPAQPGQTQQVFGGNQPAYTGNGNGKGSGALSAIDLALVLLALSGLALPALRKRYSA